jgi:glycosyltransferase involved in cell wall biosynthesis
MKVLVTVPSQKLLGGVANYYREMRNHLPAEVEYFVVGARGGRGRFVYNIIRPLVDYRRFAGTLRRNRYDLVHVNPSLVWKAVIRDGIHILLARMLGCRVLVFFRGWDKGCERSIARYFKIPFRFVYFRATAMIVLADEFARHLRDMGYRGPIHLETTLAEEQIFQQPEGQSQANAGNPRGRCHILYLSRLEEGKGVQETLEMFQALKAHHPEISLTIAGDGSLLQSARACVAKRGLVDVSLPGRVDGPDKITLLFDTDIFLFPSSYGEGMPNAVLEAMAAGLPVVTSRVGGIRDFFEDGVMGFSTEGVSVTELAAHMEKLIADPSLRERIGAHNRAYARERFAASKVAARLMDIYRSVISDAPAH